MAHGALQYVMCILQVSPERFRPNLVFSGAMQPYVEDSWQHLSIGSVPFRVTGQFISFPYIMLDPTCCEEASHFWT